MINKLRVFLQQPFPFEMSTRQIVLSLVGVGLFVSLFLVIFQPFGSAEYILEGRAYILHQSKLNLIFSPRLFFKGISEVIKKNIVDHELYFKKERKHEKSINIFALFRTIPSRP